MDLLKKNLRKHVGLFLRTENGVTFCIGFQISIHMLPNTLPPKINQQYKMSRLSLDNSSWCFCSWKRVSEMKKKVPLDKSLT